MIEPMAAPTANNDVAVHVDFAHQPWLLALALVVATVAVYLPALRGGFVWDDELLLTGNRMVQARDGLYRFWFTAEARDYYPLTSSFWWIQWRLWGKNTAGWHTVNVLLHAANVVLVWMVLRRLRIPGAWLAALLFAVHPVNVSTVAQISEQKNTLSMLFCAVAVLLYLRFDEGGGWRWYGWSLVAFLLALLSKTAVVMLPVVLLGCVWWLHGRLRSKDWRRTAPFFTLSVLLGLTTLWFQYHRALNGQDVRPGGLFTRVAVAGVAPWFYLSKAVLPLDLCLIYRQWYPETWGWSGWLPGIALAGGFALLWWKRNGWGRPLLFGFGYFVVMLFPVLGFFDQGFYGYSMVADHWQYYSIAGVTALAAAGTVAASSRLHRGPQRLVGLVAGIVVIALGALSWQHCLVFHNQETLFRDNLVHNPLAWVAHYNLGLALVNAGRTPEAAAHFQEALRLLPDYPEAHNNLGLILANAGRIQEAIGHYEQALRTIPDYPEAHNNLGFALADAGRIQEAIAHFQEALRLQPDYPEADYNLGLTLANAGRIPEAITHFQEALRLRPDFPEAHDSLGNVLLQTGQVPEAIGHYEQALRIQPDDTKARYHLGNALARAGKLDEAIGDYEQVLRTDPDRVEAHISVAHALARAGRVEEAIAHYERALRIQPGNAVAHYNVGLLYAAAGKPREAMAQYREALRLKPDYANADNNLAWLLATSEGLTAQDHEQAIQLATRASDLAAGKEPGYVDTLAAAYAAAGRFPEAMTNAGKAIDLARADGQTQLVGEIEARLELYRSGQAYRRPVDEAEPRSP